MERVLIGLLVMGFMIGTMLIAARLAVRHPRAEWGQRASMMEDSPRQSGSEPVEPARLVDTALRSALD
jgi:hypothetical protein